MSAIFTGAVIGALSVIKIDNDTSEYLLKAVNDSVGSYQIFAAFKKSLMTHFLRFLILYLFGTTFLGGPACVAYIGYIGYTLGFSSGFLLKFYGLSGFLSIIFAVVPHYLILIPTYLCFGIVIINFSNKLLFGEKKLKNHFNVYTAKTLFFAVMIFLACIVEGFISVPILKKILTLL